jgi:hypothetical protein
MELGRTAASPDRDRKWQHFLIETKGEQLTPDRVWIRRSPIGYVCAAFGKSAKLAQLAVENTGDGGLLATACRRLDRAIEREGRAKAERLGIEIPFDAIDEAPLRRLAIASALLKAGFDPNEPRDDHGDWTSGGGGAVGGAAAARTARSLAAERALTSESPLLGRLGAAALAALARLGASATAGAVATWASVLGVLFYAPDRTLNSEGTVPGRPDLRFKYDSGAGSLTIFRDGDGKSLGFTAKPGPDGVYRDEEGRAFARQLDGELILLDPNALPGAGTGSSTRDNQPKLCPDPGDDKKGPREKDIAYQGYVSSLVNPQSPLSPGLGVQLWNPVSGKEVYFDECRQSDGVMIEAKGTGYLEMLLKPSYYPWMGAENDMIDQARRQLEAAQGRPVEWYFAEDIVAEYMRDVFRRKNMPIIVKFAPPP